MEFAIKPNNPLVIAVAVILIASAIILLTSLKAPVNSSTPLPQDVLSDTDAARAPELQNIAGYINTDESLRISSLHGSVVLVDFWTYSCINCIRTLPYLNSWHQKYADDGLVIIGVHSPEFAFERDFDNVSRAVQKHGIQYPVVLDNDFATWRAYNNHYWPHKFLIDAQGRVRYDHIGEGSYDETENWIIKLLNERNETTAVERDDSTIEILPDFGQIGTPEIYFGSDFFRSSSPKLGNSGGFSLNTPRDYTLPAPSEFEFNTPYFEGTWETRGDYSILQSDTGKVALRFKAKNANIVAGAPQGAQLRIHIDGQRATIQNAGSDVVFAQEIPIVDVQSQTLYNLVSGPDYAEKLLVFEIHGRGFELYTFTFG